MVIWMIKVDSAFFVLHEIEAAGVLYLADSRIESLASSKVKMTMTTKRIE